jgi:hypothetical protein
MADEPLKEILSDLVELLNLLEEEVRALQVLTTHRVDATTTAKLAIPEKANAMHLQLQALREKVRLYADSKESS